MQVATSSRCDISPFFNQQTPTHHRTRLHQFYPFYSSSYSSFFNISLSRIITTNNNNGEVSSFQYLRKRSKRKTKRVIPISAVFDHFTERAIKSIIFSQREAKALGRDMVFTQHLLLGLIVEDRDPNGFLSSGINIDQARDAVRSIWHSDSSNQEAAIDSGDNSVSSSSSSSSDVPFSISTKRVFEAAVEYSRTMGHNFIAPEHIAIGLFTVDDGSAERVLKRLGADVNYLASAALTRLQGELAKDGREPLPGKAALLKSPQRTQGQGALAQFCVDLTALACEGLIDPVIGRVIEIERIIQILCRKTKNNPILLGESGVGKTAIAEGLAIKIAQAEVPAFLLTKRIMSLDIGLLMAGAKERGELEARVTTLIGEIKKSGDVVLFIDEVHTLIGSGIVGRGNKGSGLDIANLVKPSLGRGELQCIASTTLDEYRTQFEKDKALARRFQPVLVKEPSQEDAVRILLGLREKYEAHHNCRFTLEAINAAVYLSARYIADRNLPDKAIDLIDEAGSRARIEAFKRKKEQQSCILTKSPDDYWQEIRAVQAMHEVVLASRLKYDNKISSMDDTSELILESSLPSMSVDEPTVVGPDDIAAVASLWSGIPVQQLTADERLLLVGLDEQLKKRVIGQDEAVSAISRAVKRSRVGLGDPKRPIAAMLFCGPTGVGKTELAKALAACYFGSEEAMLRLDMSEYMERHTVSKLIGSPPGYVGYGEGGTLTEAIRRRPFTLLLLDEIEKAHPDIFNILLQLFEDGHLTDSQGRRVSFKNSLVVMTSNVGSAAIAKGRHGSIGFLIADDEQTSNAGIKALVMEELRVYFRPELLNRIDEVVVFRSLEKTQMLEILNLMLQEVKQRLMSLGIGLEVSDAIKDLVCQQGYDQIFGARPLRRTVTLIIENLLSEALLAGEYKPGDTAIIDVDASGNPCVTNGSDQSIHLSDTTSLNSVAYLPEILRRSETEIRAQQSLNFSNPSPMANPPIQRTSNHNNPLPLTLPSRFKEEPHSLAPSPPPQQQQQQQITEPQLIQSIESLGNLSTSILTFKRRFDELQKHLDFIHTAIDTRPPPSNETKSETAGPGNAEAKSEPQPSRSEIEYLCETMSSGRLRRYVASNLSDISKLREEVPAALKLAPKPARLVLDCIGRFYLQGIRAYVTDSPMIRARETSVLVLECFLRMIGESEAEIEVDSAVKEEADAAAVAWRKRLISEGGLVSAGEADARGLLFLVVGFGIPEVFTIKDFRDLIMMANLREIADAVRKSRVLLEKIPDIIEGARKDKMSIEAVDIAYIFGVEEKFPPQKILNSFLRESNDAWKQASRANNSLISQKEAKEKQLAVLNSVMKCLEYRKLDPAKLLPQWLTKENIICLEKEIADVNKKLEDKAMLKRKADVKESSAKLKSQQVKRSRFAAKGTLSESVHSTIVVSKGSYAGVHEEMLTDKVEQTMNNNAPFYPWHGAGNATYNDRSAGQSFVGQPASVERFASVGTANRSSSSDLYRFADAVVETGPYDSNGLRNAGPLPPVLPTYRSSYRYKLDL
ncbi:LOW QUALITY PROTEIN: AAA domain-containing protein/Clp_N domain-containing protein/AAA_2 domain-containing protein/Frigida domain-containing protein/ClpB_D2-small domain-containing protein [Cephalotus follicularis]|uniref:AAA domain-containing protein/Clp_N domain-containing protein/AAA_2 domain-containing protein/Frigida domain-containing protein/ClpB_D2-small domain-containing protein n=1 Tax=Cephalotus follicularis TaxID=3775 RepID=A0A1Q3BZH1_CEPFO|nr:LOW QUALITY PROTEIN: AAA domain-containing protein/Clp_N domain-containing protein/AAA_2 domain-containing protein/Frigida domain-containing protein/ClpB_D2-small domain-containing protein [Cephalotus follicularis]